jgi:hypothetical protein
MHRVKRAVAGCNTRKTLKWKTPCEDLGIIFLSSTEREAKEQLFLERFTCFQQGCWRASATLATRRRFAVELHQKIKQHFA